jgi:hypothetical protein
MNSASGVFRTHAPQVLVAAQHTGPASKAVPGKMYNGFPSETAIKQRNRAFP